ncbi:MAG: 2-oxoacid:acceptor oxidoreductase subunit alpha [Symbiobacteriaceae bacterium]|nr:2-oxoacid:acceptor oxidoreductase subunit alpha [Symbiobacteriaceae bacterium]
MIKPILMQGNEACIAGALAAGMDFFAGYPITPSTEIAELAAERLPARQGRFIQMEDEIASMGAIIGASLTGRKAMTATSGPGFSLKQENIGYAAITEVPCVVVNVQRAGPSTGIPTAPAQGDVMQARWGTHGDHPVIALSPSSVAETFDLTFRCFNLAERFRTPVILLLDEIVGHMREAIVLPAVETLELVHRLRPSGDPAKYIPYDAPLGASAPMADFGSGYPYHVTGLTHDREGFTTAKPSEVEFLIRRLASKIEMNLEEILQWEELQVEDADILLVAYGATARSARAAMKQARGKGIKVGLFRPMTIWPFPEEALRQVAIGKQVIVPEMNLGQLALEIERVVHKDITTVTQVDGEPLKPDKILAAIYNLAGTGKGV